LSSGTQINQKKIPVVKGRPRFCWKISEATLERDRSLKKGCRYLKLGGLIRYRIQDVLDYEEACTHEPKVKLKDKNYD